MASDPPRATLLHPTLRAGLWMVGALTSFLLMAIAARELSADMGLFEILFFRSLLGFFILLPLVLRKGGPGWRTKRPGGQVARNAIHFVGQYCWVAGVAVLPLAQVFALEFTMPIWVTIFAALFLGETITRTRAIAVALGFVGVLVIVRPGFEAFDPRALIVIAAAISFAISIIVTKSLTRTESALTIIFYMTLVQMPLGLVPALFDWTAPQVHQLPWIAAVGVTALTAHYTLARALKIADASTVLPIDFMRVPLVAVAGYLLYGEALSLFVLAGAAIILCANYYLLSRESRARAA